MNPYTAGGACSISKLDAERGRENFPARGSSRAFTIYTAPGDARPRGSSDAGAPCDLRGRRRRKAKAAVCLIEEIGFAPVDTIARGGRAPAAARLGHLQPPDDRRASSGDPSGPLTLPRHPERGGSAQSPEALRGAREAASRKRDRGRAQARPSCRKAGRKFAVPAATVAASRRHRVRRHVHRSHRGLRRRGVRSSRRGRNWPPWPWPPNPIESTGRNRTSRGSRRSRSHTSTDCRKRRDRHRDGPSSGL
jgi:hypothetical protein